MDWTVPSKCGLDRRGVGRGGPFCCPCRAYLQEMGSLPPAQACSLLSRGHTEWAHYGPFPTYVHPQLSTHGLAHEGREVLSFWAAISGQHWVKKAGDPGVLRMRLSCPMCKIYRKLKPRGCGSLCSDLGQAVTPNPQHWTLTLCLEFRQKRTLA